MGIAKEPVREDLFCPECASPGMRPQPQPAESGRKRYRCVSCGFRTTSTLYTPPQLLPKTRVSDIKKHKRFIITSAVNDTLLVHEAHETFKRMAKELDACYLVIPGVYKNPDLKHQGVINNYTWPAEIMPYLCNTDVQLNRSITIRGLTRIQYTAINPLSGMNHAGGIESEVYGHPQIAMQMVPTAKNSLPKMLHTTGSISVKNYGGSKTAKKAEFHHAVGALFIEIEGNKFWPTQLRFDGEGVYLFNRFYTPKSSRRVDRIPGIVFGDTHIRFLRKKVAEALDKVRSSLRPETLVFHDIHDHHVGSHHNEHNTVFNLKMSLKQEISIRQELMMIVDFLRDKPNAVIVDSNHHRHLNQWFNRFNPHRDNANLELYAELMSLVREDLLKNGDGNLLRLFIQKYSKIQPRFVGGNDDFSILDIDCSQHGDIGPNGSRGSVRSFSKTGHKTIIAHSHTPGIEKSCYQVGTSTDDAEYAVGYSSWMITHCLIYPNGKRGLFSLVDDKLSPLMRAMK